MTKIKVFNLLMLGVVMVLLLANSGCNTLPITDEQAHAIADRVGGLTTGVVTALVAKHMPDDLKDATVPEGSGGASDPLSGAAGGFGGGIVGLAVYWLLNALRKKSKENLIKEVKDAATG